LQSHAGRIDELVAINGTNPEEHYIGARWDRVRTRVDAFKHTNIRVNPDEPYSYDATLRDGEDEAQWVPVFNGAIRAVARLFGDTVLDHYTLSIKLLQHIQAVNQREHLQRIEVHSDSLHYCAGGLFRAGNLLLSDLIEHRRKCHRHHEVHHTML
jgi:hypothetical protein